MVAAATSFLAFSVVALSAHMFGKMIAFLGLPTITIFIGFGLACGPFCLGLLTLDDSAQLSWINNVALGFIGFSAGGHFHISDMRAVISTASIVLATLVVVSFVGMLAVVLLVGDIFIPFFATLNSAQKMAAALLFSCLGVARSPSSAIALIAELNAHGPFTSTVLAVTVLIDVVVVVLFSVTLTMATTLDPTGGGRMLGEEEESGENIALTLFEEFVTEIGLSTALGVLLGLLIPVLITFGPTAKPWPSAPSVPLKALAVAALLLLLRAAALGAQRTVLPGLGWALFKEEELAHHDPAWAWGAWLNPLIASMVAGFIVVNFTQAGHAFHETTDAVSGPIFLYFFCYTGVSMNVGVLLRNVPVCIFIFSLRTLLVWVATRLGGSLAGSPPDHTAHYWMTFLTQAGVTLGLANSAAAHFDWGEDFAASIVAVSVLNQVVGPVLMKRALRGVGEDHHNYVPIDAANVDEHVGQTNVPLTSKPQPRGAIVIAQPGDRTARVVMKRLRQRGWEVIEADAELRTLAVTNDDQARLERNANHRLEMLPRDVRDKVTATAANGFSPKPWSKLRSAVKTANAFGGGIAAAARTKRGASRRSLALKTMQRRSSSTDGSSRNTLRGYQRRATLTPSLPAITELLKSPEVPTLPESEESDPERHMMCLRLLWLWASMKSLDVVICLLPTDDANLEICELIGDMGPALKSSASAKNVLPPQVVVTLDDADDADRLFGTLEPPPLVIPSEGALSSLICEVLHPTAHWSGSLEGAHDAQGTNGAADADAGTPREDMLREEPTPVPPSASFKKAPPDEEAPAHVSPPAPAPRLSSRQQQQGATRSADGMVYIAAPRQPPAASDKDLW